ncbi:MAG: response regulator [Acidobacteriota bacterium]
MKGYLGPSSGKKIMKEHRTPLVQKARSVAHLLTDHWLAGVAVFVALLLSVGLFYRGSLLAHSTVGRSRTRLQERHQGNPASFRRLDTRVPALANDSGLPETTVIKELRHWNSALSIAAILIFISFLWAEILRRRVRNQTELLQEWARREVALKKKYQELFENANDIIFTTDLEGKLTSINRAAEQLTGYSRSEAFGADISQYVAEECRELVQQLLNRKLQEDTPTTDYMEIVTKSGRKVPLEVRSRVVYEDGKPAGLQGIARDITARKRAERERQKAREAAEAANRAKGEFLANMSHEIRTPLNGILGMTELALNTELSEEQREYVSMAKASGETLLTVINDILDFSKMEAGHLDLNLVDFDLRDALGDTLKTLSLRAHQKGLELTLRIASDVPVRLEGDPTRLRQVVVNLVSNAIKFTDQGEVVLQAAIESQTEEEIFLHFTVTDTGIGIPPDKQRMIFAPFTQADSSATRRYGGTGLGLAISLQLVELMQGRLWVESQEGKGSTFHFTARFSPSTSNEHAVAPAESANLQGLAALVVDDNATNRRIVEEMLVTWGMRPAMADGGWTGLDAMERATAAGKPFPLVLIDACMPDMDGFTLAGRIKQNPTLAGATIMMLTSAGRRGDAARCRELGIAAYLHKPIRERDLLQAIFMALAPDRKSAKDAELITRHALLEQRRNLRVLLAEDDLVNRQLAERLLEKAGYQVTTVQNGREAVAAVRASGHGGFDVILMDVQMPVMNGTEATAAIRAMEIGTSTHLPIIAMTAHAMKGDRARFLASGMDGYIAKPVEARLLVSAIEEALPVPRDPRAEPGPEKIASSAIDWKRGLARVEGDSELFRDLLKLFACEAPAALDELRTSVESKDATGIERRAHKLKGSLSNFGADEAVQAASRLETLARDGDLEPTGDVFRNLENEVGRVLAEIETAESEVAG